MNIKRVFDGVIFVRLTLNHSYITYTLNITQSVSKIELQVSIVITRIKLFIGDKETYIKIEKTKKEKLYTKNSIRFSIYNI